MVKTDVQLKKVTLFVNANLHGLMKEYAKRKRLQLGVAYDQAIQMYLSGTNQYMGTKRERQLKKG